MLQMSSCAGEPSKMATILMIQTPRAHKPSMHLSLHSSLFGNLGVDMTPRQDSLSGVIIRPSGVRFVWLGGG